MTVELLKLFRFCLNFKISAVHLFRFTKSFLEFVNSAVVIKRTLTAFLFCENRPEKKNPKNRSAILKFCQNQKNLQKLLSLIFKLL